VCQIVELWGMGEALDEERILEIAKNIYGASREAVREALIANMKNGRIKGASPDDRASAKVESL
jgi:hypothetical protein